MVLTSLAIAGVSTLAAAATYAYVGAHLLRKGDVGVHGRPLFMLGLWWLATAANQAMGGALYVAAAFGWTDLAVQLTYVHVQRLLVAVSLVGLLYYLLFLLTGRRTLVALWVVYGLWFASQVYNVSAGVPDGVSVFRWRTDLHYAIARPAAWSLLGLVIVVPPIVAALSLLRVYRRVETPTQRFRIAVLSGAFTLWWAVAFIAGNAAAFDVDAIQLLNRAVGVLVALAVLVAYEPFGWMQRRFDLKPFASQD